MLVEDEMLVKVVCSPTHVRHDGTLKPSLFAPKHISEKGVSLIRQRHLGKDALNLLAAAIAHLIEDRKVAGVAVGTVNEIRTIVDEGINRSLCLFDDPVRDAGELTNEAHATGISPQTAVALDEALRIQKVLMQIFGRLRSVEDVYRQT